MPKNAIFQIIAVLLGAHKAILYNQLYNQTAEMLRDFAAKKLLAPLYFHISVPGSISIIDC